jgi:uncharacterized membrane protein YebE (DUF533 family)
MNATKVGIAANIVGIIVAVLAIFGIEVDEETRKALIAGITAIGLVINQVLIMWAQRQQPVKPDNKLIPEVARPPINSENGFAQVHCMALLLALAVTLLSACAVQPAQTPRQSLLAAYTAAESAANTIEIAKHDGVIDAAKRDELMVSVKQARDLLNSAREIIVNDPAPGSVNDTQAQASLRAAQNILLTIQAALPKESTP